MVGWGVVVSRKRIRPIATRYGDGAVALVSWFDSLRIAIFGD